MNGFRFWRFTIKKELLRNITLLTFWLLLSLAGRVSAADWAANFGGFTGENSNTQATAADASGNTYLAGYFYGSTLTLGNVTLTKIGAYDAFVAKLDASGTVLWVKNFGGSGAWAYGKSIAVDGSGNVYLGGYFQSANLTTPALTNIGTYDAFALKLDSSGSIVWAKNFGGSGTTTNGNGIAVDGSGNVYLGGYFTTGNLTTPALTKIGTQDAFALKLDSTGTTVWAKNFGGSAEYVYGNGIAVDDSGNVYLGGYFTGPNSLTTPALTKIGGRDAFAFKLDSTGATTWAKNFGGSGYATGTTISVDGSGNVYLGGYYNGNLTTPALTKIGTQDAFAFKLDSTGATTWARSFGGSGAYAWVYCIAVDGSGNVHLGGDFDTANLTTPALTKIGIHDAFALKLDSIGVPTLARNFGGNGASAYGYGIAVDGSGIASLGGYFYNANLTTPALTKNGTGDAFALKLGSSGATTWAKNFAAKTLRDTYGYVTANDTLGNTYLAGSFGTPTLTLGSVTLTLTSIGSQDAFVAKLDPSGKVLWAKNFGGSNFAYVYVKGVAVDGSGNVYLGGDFSANLTTPALTKIGNGDAFVLKLNSSGTITWAKNFGGSGTTTNGNGIAVDGSGNVYLGGYFQSGNLTTPPLTRIGTTLGSGTAFALKLDSSGAITWAKNFGGSSASVYGRSIAVDGSGNVYLGGDFDSGNLTTPALTRIGLWDAFALKLSSSGATIWAKNFGDWNAYSWVTAIAVDSAGYVYLGGSFDGVNLSPMYKIGFRDAFALKLDSTGATIWGKNFGGSSASAYGRSIAVDGSGNVYLGGYFDSANLTTPTLTKIGSQDAFALKLDSSGATTWAKNFGGSGATAYGQGIGVGGSGNVYLAGYFTGANLTTSPLTKVGANDAFIIAALTNTHPTAITGSVSSITTTTATLGGSVSDNGALTTVTFQYGPNTNYGSTASGGTVEAGSGATVVSAAISGLTCNATYHYRVSAINSDGSTYGTDAIFTTSTCIAQPITFDNAPTIIVGNAGTVNATGGGSGNPVVFTSQTPAVCTTSGINGTTVTGVTLGTCLIAASQAGNTVYAAAQVSQSFDIYPPPPPTLTTPSMIFLGANSATLALQSSASGTGYFTLLPGSNASCGTGDQIKAGKDSLGNPAYRIGSRPLTANIPYNYTVRNLTESTSYTVCFTADNGFIAQPVAVTTNLTTNVTATPAAPAWNPVWSAGFSTGQVYSTSLAFAPDGTPYVAYQDVSNGSKVTVVKYSGGAWTNVGNAGFSAGSVSYTFLAFAPDGTPYVTYQDSSNSSKATVMKYSGGAWSLVGSAGFSAGQASYTSLAFSPDSTPYVVYADTYNSWKATVQKYSGGTWNLVGNSGLSPGAAHTPSLTFAPDGTPFVAYQDGGNGSKATVMKYSGGAWSLVGNAGFSAGTVNFTALVFAPDGTPFVAYQDGANGSKTTVMKYSGGFWSLVGSVGFSAGQASYTSLAFSPDGTPYVAYQDSGNGSKATLMKYSGGAWSLVGNAGFSAGQASYTSLAFAHDGTPYVAYSDSAKSYKATVMRYATATSVVAINRLTPSGPLTNAASVSYRITFADPVSGITAANFDLSPTVTGATVTGVSSIGAPPTTQWDIAVTTGSTEGSISLRLANSGGISPGIATLLPYVGQAYTIDRTRPTVSMGSPTASRVQDNAVDYAITYTDPNFSTSTLSVDDVILNKTGTANGTVSISGTGNSRIITISSIAGSGTMWISVAAGTATDLAGNSTLVAGPSATFSVPLSAPPTLAIPAVTNISANSATLILRSSVTGTGYFTLLTGSNVTCGNGPQTKAGQDGLGNPAFRIGSLQLTADVPGYYTVRNLIQSTPYTVCFTAGDNGLSLQPVTTSTNLATTASQSTSSWPVAPAWRPVGNSGFSGGIAYYTSMAFAPDGTPYVAYQDYSNNYKATVMKYSGGTWSVVGNLGFSLGQATYISMAVGLDGTPYIAYMDSGNGYKTTVMKYSGGTWSMVGNTGLGSGQTSYISLAFAPDGTPYVAYQDSGYSFKVIVMRYSAVGWTTVGNAGFSTGQASYTSLVFAPDGTPYIAYQDSGYSSKATVLKYSGGAWSIVGNPGVSIGQANYTSLAFAPDGTPYIAYQDSGNNYKATVMKYSDGVWNTVGSAGFSAGSASYTSLAFAPNGIPYTTYRDNANGSMDTVMMFSGGYWSPVGHPGFSAGPAQYTSLAFASDGTPYVTYQDGGNSTKATVMKLVETAPSTLTTMASNISATDATLNGTVNDNGATSTITFDYGLTSSYGSSASGGTVAANSGTTPVSAAISGLTCNTTYHFRVSASNAAGTATGTDATFTTAPCFATLTVSLPGSGGGSVNSDPAGIACTSGSASGCSTTFPNGTQITLTATPDWKSSFSGWGVPCSGTGSSLITLTGDSGVTATFAKVPRVRIPGPTATDYASLQEAYDSSAPSATLATRVYTFFEDLVLSRDIAVTLSCGMSDDFATIAGFTTLHGSLTVGQGMATISNLIIE